MIKSSSKGISEYKEIELDTGLSHGRLYKPLEEWVKVGNFFGQRVEAVHIMSQHEKIGGSEEMANLLIKHKVTDYSTWKAAFDEFIDARRAAGERAWRIWHTDDDPNNLVLLFEWDSLDNARSFMANPELKQVMERAGVTEQPDVLFLEEHYRGKTRVSE